MSLLRPFSALDLFEFNAINLDVWTETYGVNYYLSYLMHWGDLFSCVLLPLSPLSSRHLPSHCRVNSVVESAGGSYKIDMSAASAASGAQGATSTGAFGGGEGGGLMGYGARFALLRGFAEPATLTLQ